MIRWIVDARTRCASGRFLFLTLVLAGACQPVAPAQAGPQDRFFPDPVIERGTIGPAQQARAAEIFVAAETARDADRLDEAVALAQRIVDDFPRASVSGRALWLLARAAEGNGEHLRADSAAGRFVALLSGRDPRHAEARLLQAASMIALEDAPSSLRRFLLIERGAPTNAVLQGVEQARAVAAAIDDVDEMAAIVAETPGDRPLLPVALSRYAGLLYEIGDDEEAKRFARAAVAAGARGVDSLFAEGILSESSFGGARRTRVVRVGSVLPTGGSPALSDFARLISEGVEVAAATYLDSMVHVEVEEKDDEGDPFTAAERVAELEESRVLGAVGFLEEGALEVAAEGRRSSLALISPTARTTPEDGVYSLAGADPQAASTMARYAALAGYMRVAILHSMAPASTEEADAFEETLSSMGVPVAGRFVYPAGATFFGDQIRGARDALRADEIRALGLTEEDTLDVAMLEPVALFIPIPPEDVELLAPQVTFYGLDTLAIEVLGTSGWTDAQTLQTVDTRHTTGVVATSPLGSCSGSPGFRRFEEAYETHFQRSLISPVPALGYDATLLLLEASRAGARTPGQVRRALEDVRDLEGATGVFSVRRGRVVRLTELVRIEHGTLIPIG